ncbi:hypothetical protein PVL29_013777 [Vitis rotundifolia]|uniref:S-protein homolog n=1 Tax=Vitis rotundifolia TaxID=103349 RepID=A0AA38ZM96_VITRO|nr:hypothetical protein PVL29_013777 [Vitis rotundifolia]
MDLTLLRKFHAFILIVVIISLCASTGFSFETHVYMTNNLGDNTIIYLHCLKNFEEMGHQQIPYHWTCQWWFRVTYPGLLLCEANVQGAKQLQFLAYNTSKNTCRGDCHWNFTQQGVFQNLNGEWKLQYKWPH